MVVSLLSLYIPGNVLSERVETRGYAGQNEWMSKSRDVCQDSAQYRSLARPCLSLGHSVCCATLRLYKHVRCSASLTLTLLPFYHSTMRAFLFLNVAAIAGLSSLPCALAWGAAGMFISHSSQLCHFVIPCDRPRDRRDHCPVAPRPTGPRRCLFHPL